MTDEQAPFNMAISTLMRLDAILKEIKAIDSNILIPKSERQEIKISLVKNFFYNSVPLLKEEAVKKYREEIINLNPMTIQIYERRSSIIRPVGNQCNYDPQLNSRLDNLMIDMQISLQEKGHFMPSWDEGGWD